MTQIAERLVGEIRIDVHVEIERAAGIRRVAIEEVADAIVRLGQVEVRFEEHRHAQVTMKVDRWRDRLVDEDETARVVELEPRQLREPAIAGVDVAAEGARPALLSLQPPLSREQRAIRLGVAGFLGAATASGRQSRPRPEMPMPAPPTAAPNPRAARTRKRRRSIRVGIGRDDTASSAGAAAIGGALRSVAPRSFDRRPEEEPR